VPGYVAALAVRNDVAHVVWRTQGPVNEAAVICGQSRIIPGTDTVVLASAIDTDVVIS